MLQENSIINQCGTRLLAIVPHVNKLISLFQANALKMELEAKEVPVNVYVAMRYWHPFTEEAVQQA